MSRLSAACRRPSSLAYLLLTLMSGLELSAQQLQWEEPDLEYPGQEPIVFRRRSGIASTDAVEHWKRVHSEETIRKIAASGRRFLFTHFYKGFGFAAEKEEMDLTIRTGELVRKHGMALGVYVQFGTIVGETFFHEDPRAQNWVLRDRDGQPVKINYGHFYWRYLPDIRNREYLDYYKEKILRYCVEKVRPRYIYLDNVAETPPVSWQPLHNPTWVEGFREYLTATYSPAELTEMLGYPYVDFIEPPHWLWGSRVVVNDPVMQRWIDFRCRSLTDAIAEVRGFIKELDPTIAVGVNIHGFSRSNRAIDGVDPVAICRDTGIDGWGGENWVHPELTGDGVLISPIHEYKACRTLGVAFTSGGRPPKGITPLAKLVNLAFSHRRPIPGGGWLGGPFRFGYLNGPETFEPMREHLDYYHDVETIADVAVLRSYPSIAYNSIGPLTSTIGFEQVLIQEKVPFDIIFDDNLSDLSKYKVLVLADVECMSDEQVELVRSFVRGGGGLVATGSTSLYNQWRRPRPRFGLGDVLGLTESDARMTLNAYTTFDAVSTWTGVEGIQTRINEFGKGRAVYVPRVVPAYDGPAVRMDLPKNWPELKQAVTWAAGGELSTVVRAPQTVVMELTAQRAKGRIMLQLVNFKGGAIRDIPADLKVPDGKKVESVTLLSTDWEGETAVKFRQTSGRVEFKVPRLQNYDLLVIQLER